MIWQVFPQAEKNKAQYQSVLIMNHEKCKRYQILRQTSQTSYHGHGKSATSISHDQSAGDERTKSRHCVVHLWWIWRHGLWKPYKRTFHTVHSRVWEIQVFLWTLSTLWPTTAFKVSLGMVVSTFQRSNNHSLLLIDWSSFNILKAPKQNKCTYRRSSNF